MQHGYCPRCPRANTKTPSQGIDKCILLRFDVRSICQYAGSSHDERVPHGAPRSTGRIQTVSRPSRGRTEKCLRMFGMLGQNRKPLCQLDQPQALSPSLLRPIRPSPSPRHSCERGSWKLTAAQWWMKYDMNFTVCNSKYGGKAIPWEI